MDITNKLKKIKEEIRVLNEKLNSISKEADSDAQIEKLRKTYDEIDILFRILKQEFSTLRSIKEIEDFEENVMKQGN